MKLIIFGATGGTGQQLVKQALEQGYKVTAFARSPDKVESSSNKLRITKGDVLKASDVQEALKGHDAVLCALGMSNIMDKSGLRANGTANIVSAMQHAKVERLVCLSALGTGDSYRLLPLPYKFFIAPLFMQRLYRDHLAQENCIMASSLKWVIVRPGTLSDGPLTKVYKHGFSDSENAIAAKISRADTADFMLKQLSDDTLLCKSPYISY